MNHLNVMIWWCFVELGAVQLSKVSFPIEIKLFAARQLSISLKRQFRFIETILPISHAIRAYALHSNDTDMESSLEFL